MKGRGLLILLLAASVGAREGDIGFAGFAAIAAGGGSSGYLLYSWRGSPLTLTTAGLQIAAIGVDGKSLYGIAHGARGIKRIDLLSKQVSILPGSESFPFIDGLAVSARQDFVFVIARDSTFFNCGLYVLLQPGGKIRTIRERYPCSGGWAPPSISPDSKRVILASGGKIEALDLATGSLAVVGSYENAAWAPNGKWIAVFGGKHLGLLDPVTFRLVKSLGRAFSEHPAWSQDSRYLLIEQPDCGPYFFSLSALDVVTGKRAEVKGAHCNVQAQGHWVVSDEVYRAEMLRQPPPA